MDRDSVLVSHRSFTHTLKVNSILLGHLAFTHIRDIISRRMVVITAYTAHPKCPPSPTEGNHTEMMVQGNNTLFATVKFVLCECTHFIGVLIFVGDHI